MNKNKTRQEEIAIEFINEVLKLKPEDRERARLMLLAVEKSESVRAFIDRVFALVKERQPLGIEMKGGAVHG